MYKLIQITFILLAFVGIHDVASQTPGSNVTYLELNTPRQMYLIAGRTTVFRIDGVFSLSFVLLQVHTHHTSLDLSLTPNWVHGESTRGRDVGAVAMVKVLQGSVDFYVNATADTKAIVMAAAYERKSPVPGGCNQELPLRLDPNIKVTWDTNTVTMEFAYANFGVSQGSPEANCELRSYQSRMTYDVYQYFLPRRDWTESTYLSVMEGLLRADELRQQAVRVKTVEYKKGRTLVKFAAYPGQGTMFGVVVNEMDANNNTLTASYVPASTYTCIRTVDGTCAHLNDLPMQVLSCILGAFGLVLCLCGHRYFKFSMFTFGMLAFGMLAYILIARFARLDYEYTLVISSCCGLIGGAVWLAFWCLVGVPVLSVLLAGLVMGFSVSSVVFNLTPLGLIDTFSSDFNYGMAFACGVLVLPVILLAFTKKLSLLSCTVVGSYLIITAIDSFLHSNVPFIVLNSIRKGAIIGYTQTLATMPLQLVGILLLVAWGVLVLVGLIVQSFMERDRPDFPACPYDRFKERQQRRRQMEELAGSRNMDDEREPLLRSNGRRSYGRPSSTPQFQETPPRNSPPPAYNRIVDPL